VPSLPSKRPWDEIPLVPADKVPSLPWSPPLEPTETRGNLWPLCLVGLGFAAVQLAGADDPSWQWGTAALLGPLWETLKAACARWTVTDDGLVITGPLLRRTYSWATVSAIEVRRYQVTVDVGGRRRRTGRFDGRKGRPAAPEVAGVMARVRSLNTSGLQPVRVSLSWGAAVILPAAGAVLAATAWALFKG